jgi:hypothetical protein
MVYTGKTILDAMFYEDDLTKKMIKHVTSAILVLCFSCIGSQRREFVVKIDLEVSFI